MERFAAEVFERERVDAIKRALKAKMSFPDIMVEFELSREELEVFIKKYHLDGGPPRKDDLKDARDAPSGKGATRGRR